MPRRKQYVPPKDDKPLGVGASIFKPKQADGYLAMLLEESGGNRLQVMYSYVAVLEKTQRSESAKPKGPAEIDDWQDAANVVAPMNFMQEKDVLEGRDLAALDTMLGEFRGNSSRLEKAKTYATIYQSLRKRLFPELYEDD
ncbi:MAG: hypothetical protein ABH834_04255 [Candidatus Altiarchaeota archaeon]